MNPLNADSLASLYCACPLLLSPYELYVQQCIVKFHIVNSKIDMYSIPNLIINLYIIYINAMKEK